MYQICKVLFHQHNDGKYIKKLLRMNKLYIKDELNKVFLEKSIF